MSILIGVQNLTKSFGTKRLFENLNFVIEKGDRIGLIGPNGAGKSTLLKILSQRTKADSGNLTQQKGIVVSYLEQDPKYIADSTLISTLIGNGQGDLEWENFPQAQEWISKIGLDHFDLEMPVAKLSGGWRKRLALARELMVSPDILMLDEPTNHLDVETILWLEDFLLDSSYTTVTITHDRAFLQRVSTRILELDPRHADGLLNVKGDYATYLRLREEKLAAQEQHESVLRNQFRRESEWLARGAKARTTKQTARIDRAGELESNLDEVASRNVKKKLSFEFQATDRLAKKLIEGKQITKSFGDRVLFKDLDVLLSPGSRIALLGQNGCGKSTLIKILLGKEQPTSGTVVQADTINVAYFDQARQELNGEVSLLRAICPEGEFVKYRGQFMHARGYLGRFHFSQEQFDMPVKHLSGGEQSRLFIARLMLNEANVLVLDEPTNDLDVATLNVLQECLEEFEGAVLLVSHDRYFLDSVCDRMLAFHLNEKGNNDLEWFTGVEQWERWIRSRPKTNYVSDMPIEAGQIPAAVSSEPIKKPAKKLSFKEQREYDEFEQNIQKLEAEVKALETEISSVERASQPKYLVEATNRLAEIEQQILKAYERWENLDAKQK